MDDDRLLDQMAELYVQQRESGVRLAGLAYRLYHERNMDQRAIRKALAVRGESASAGRLSKMITAYRFWVHELGFAESDIAHHGYAGLYNRYVAATRFPGLDPRGLLGSRGFIYLVRDEGTGHHKIGITADPVGRWDALQVHASSALTMRYLFRLDDFEAGEQLLHDHFGDKRLSGEWFDLSEEDIDDLVSFMEPV